jgi:NADH-quinone oxidoreductase subunit J
MSLDTIIFGFSAVVAVFGAVMMISQRNPVASVLYLILSFVAQAVLYIQLGALFVGVMLIIVYAGAILVLFLFVIMLLNLRGTEDLGKHSPPLNLLVKGVVSFLLLVELLFVIRGLYIQAPSGGMMTMQPDSFGSARSVATLLFTKYLYPFELTGVLLLAAVVGAVVIARRESPEETEAPSEAGEKSIEQPTDKVVK